jgi:hypothetical protein
MKGLEQPLWPCGIAADEAHVASAGKSTIVKPEEIVGIHGRGIADLP